MHAKELINKMAPKFRSGYILMDDGDLKLYVLFLLAMTIFFFLLFELIRIVLTKLELEVFVSKTNDQRVWYLNAWVTIIHHYMILAQIYYALYYSCANPEGWPWPTEEGGSYTNLSSDKRWGYLKD